MDQISNVNHNQLLLLGRPSLFRASKQAASYLCYCPSQELEKGLRFVLPSLPPPKYWLTAGIRREGKDANPDYHQQNLLPSTYLTIQAVPTQSRLHSFFQTKQSQAASSPHASPVPRYEPLLYFYDCLYFTSSLLFFDTRSFFLTALLIPHQLA